MTNLASAHIVRLDFDGERPTEEELQRRAVRACVEIVDRWGRPSPSGRGWHLELAVLPVPQSAMEVVALQLLFGSDPLREAYNLNRARLVDGGKIPGFWSKPERWNVLYRRQHTG